MAPSSPASADSILGSNEPACELCGSASRTPSAEGFLPGTGPASLVIPMCAPLFASPKATDADRGGRGDLIQQVRGNWNPHFGKGCPCRCHTSTSSAAGSPARTSASPAAGPDWPANARVFGGSSQGSLGNYDPATSSLKTCQRSLLGDSTESLRILPRAGSMRSGIIFQRQPLAPLTGGTASGSLPTPAATMADRGGRGDLLQVVRGNPSPSGHFKMLPTPNARDWKDTGPTQGNRKSPNLGTVAHLPTPTANRWDGLQSHGRNVVSGSLNPTWVEWLMGYPAGWTDCEPSGTALFPRSPNGSAARSSNGSA